MPPYKYHGMITLNHSMDGLENSPEGEAKRHQIVTQIAQLRGITLDYGMSAIELGTGTDSDNWHLHIAFKGKYNSQTSAKTVHNYMNKLYTQTYPTATCKHIDITSVHHGSKCKWKWDDMIDYLREVTEKKPSPPYLDNLRFDQTVYFGEKNDEECTADNIKDGEQEDIDWFAKLREDKATNKPQHEVIEHTIAEAQREGNENVFLLMNYYRSLPPAKIQLLPNGHTLYPWQTAVAAFAADQWHADKPNGLWLRLKAGAGKTEALKHIMDNHSVFIPGVRPGGGYDCNSFLSYNNEEIVLFNEIQPHVTKTAGGEQVHYKRAFIELLKKITDNFPMAMQFGREYTRVLVKAKIICTSNYPLPPDPQGALPRRYIQYASEDDVLSNNSVYVNNEHMSIPDDMSIDISNTI